MNGPGLPPSPSWLETPPPRVAPPAVRRPRSVLPLVLVALTFLTTSMTGGFYYSTGAAARAIELAFDNGGFALGLLAIMVAGLPYSLAVMLFFLAHEMGHYVACRRYGVDSTLPYFIPAPLPFPFGTLGAVIRIRSVIPTRRALFDIGIAGPIAGFVVALPLLVAGTLQAEVATPGQLAGPGIAYGDSLLSFWLATLLRPDAPSANLIVTPLYMAGWLGLLATAMNLIPAGQLDGGHIVFALAPRWHRAVGLAAGAFLLTFVTTRALWFREFSPWVLWAVVVLWLGRRHPPVPDWEARLGPLRVALAVAALAILLLCFMPVPVTQIN